MDYVGLDYAQHHLQEHEEILHINGEYLSANILGDISVLLHHKYPEGL
jgi:hypothetical protein